MSTPHRTGGQQVVHALVRSGIRQAFTVPGESFLGLLDALRDSPIRVTATRHEGGAAFMAEAYGQLTGQPALCVATRAVGAANLSIGLHTARQDSTPLVAIVGQVPRPFRGRESFQEVDQVETFGRLCKAAVEVDDPRRLHAETTRMVSLARSGRPGPVLISIPEDVLDAHLPQAARAAGDDLAWFAPDDFDRAELPERPAPSPEEVEHVLELLAGARRPVILGGAGILRSGAVNMLRAFAETAEIPVIAAWRRPDIFSNDLPQYLGMTGLGAARTVEPRLLQADVILAIGTRLSEIATFRYRIPGRAARLIHVDIEPGLTGDRARPALSVRADARAFLRRALETMALARRLGIPDLVPGDRLAASRAAELARDRAAYLAAVVLPEGGGRRREREPSPGGVDPASVVASLSRHLEPDAILTTDAGNFASWAARYLQIRQGGRFLGPTSGAMGYGLPAGIGAAIAAQSAAQAAAQAAVPEVVAEVVPEVVAEAAADDVVGNVLEEPAGEPPLGNVLEGSAGGPPSGNVLEEPGGGPALDGAASPAAGPTGNAGPDTGPGDAASVTGPGVAAAAPSGSPPGRAPRRQVVALAGDGGFAMLMAELETAVRERLRLAVLVFDNGMYGTIRMHQEAAHPGRVVATDLGPIDFAAVAEACGARALRVESDADVDPAIEAALADDCVTVVHLRVDPRYLSIDRRLPR